MADNKKKYEVEEIKNEQGDSEEQNIKLCGGQRFVIW